MSEEVRILVVEDNPADTDLIREALPETGPVSFRIESVARLAEALARMASKAIDLVLLDLGLPDSHGLQTLQKLRQAAPDIPVIVLTGTDDQELAVAAVRDGAQDYLIKGQASGSFLVRAARYALERRKAAEALRESEERFRRAITDSPFPILLHADDGTILQASNSWCESTGYTREELGTIADWTERAYGDRKTLVQAEIDALYKLDRRKYEGDYTIRTKSGDTRVWEFSSAPLGPLSDGRRLVISMAMDVTERRQAETALQAKNEELLRFNQAAVGRELRMVELKRQVNELCRQMGKPAPYPLDFAEAGAQPSAAAGTVGPEGASSTEADLSEGPYFKANPTNVPNGASRRAAQ